jgi:O-acetylserine/cysteine efflux transporter
LRTVTWALAVTTLILFVFWSNSFIAIGFLLGADGNAPSFDWVGLTVARFVPAAAICAAWCALFRRTESLRLLRQYPLRLIACGFLAVPGYNLALYYGQEHGVPAPVASLTTALLPFFVMVLAAVFLGEPATLRRFAGFAVGAAGMVLIARSRSTGVTTAYPFLIAVTALAPLCWSAFSVASKPLAGRVSPVVWTYLVTAIGGAMVLPLLPAWAWHDWTRLDRVGWGALLYLVIPCTVLGFALWTWLLRHLPASAVGFTVFLNPPLTALSKYLLASWYPETFVFRIQTAEWIGGGLTLAGLAIALSSRPRR